MRRVLFIKPKRIGDMLLFTPTASALKKAVPRIRIEVLAHENSAEILRSFSRVIDRVWKLTGVGCERRLSDDSASLLIESFNDVIELSGQSYAGKILHDCIGERKYRSCLYDKYGENFALAESCAAEVFQPEWRNQHAMKQDWLVTKHALKVKIPPPTLDFPVRKTDFPVLAPPITKRFAVFQPFSKDPDRTWSCENWRTLAKVLLKRGLVDEIVIPFGSHDEGTRAAWIANGIEGCRLPTWGLTFPSHASLAQQAMICVTCNTGVMHLAAAVGSPIVTVWGETPISRWYPLCDTFSIVCKNQIVQVDRARDVTCDPQEGAISDNSVGTVIQAVEQVLRRESENGSQ